MAHATVAELFWPKVHKTETCWLWTAATDGYGYGTLRIKKRSYRAHRVSWELHIGPIPAGVCVLHRCDTPLCVNPAHLFLGTRADNTADMMAKGRGRWPGPRRPAGRLTPADVQAIKLRLAAGETQLRIAEDYPVTNSTIHLIAKGKRYRDPHQRPPAGTGDPP